MKARLSTLLFLLVFGAVIGAVLPSVLADEARFFRVVGPATTGIIVCSQDGYITWTNAQPGTSYTVQIASSLRGGADWCDYIQIPASNSIVTHRLYDPNPPPGMVFIPAGSFTMGDCMAEGYSDEFPVHTLHVSAVYMERYLVTSSLWTTVSNWSKAHGYTYGHGALCKAAEHPVDNISWRDAVAWCNARSEMEGLVPCYYGNAGLTTVYRSGSVMTPPYVKWNANGYRLPTEAEWEKGARGGARGHRFPWSNVDTITHSQANYRSQEPQEPFDLSPTHGCHPLFDDGIAPYTSPVGFFAPNGYGLYDMVGNVAEWCWDYYDASWYSNVGAVQDDTRGPSSGSGRVYRGGAYWDMASRVRCSSRQQTAPGAPFDIGLRCVRGP